MNSAYLEHEQRELARGTYQTIDTTGLGRFTFSFIDSRWEDLNMLVRPLDRLPEAEFKDLIGVIYDLREARDELRLARFLFDLKEISSVHRLVMRNRFLLTAKRILRKILDVWPER